MPSPVSRYINTSTVSSTQPTRLFQSSTSAAMKQRNGTTTATRLMARWRRLMAGDYPRRGSAGATRRPRRRGDPGGTRVEHVRDLVAARDDREPLVEAHSAGLEGGQPQRRGELQLGVAEQRVGQPHALGELVLILERLRAQAEHARAQLAPARRGRRGTRTTPACSPARPGSRPSRAAAARPASRARVDVEHQRAGRLVPQIEVRAGRGRQADLRQRHPREVVRRAVVLGHREVRRQALVALGHGLRVRE